MIWRNIHWDVVAHATSSDAFLNKVDYGICFDPRSGRHGHSSLAYPCRTSWRVTGLPSSRHRQQVMAGLFVYANRILRAESRSSTPTTAHRNSLVTSDTCARARSRFDAPATAPVSLPSSSRSGVGTAVPVVTTFDKVSSPCRQPCGYTDRAILCVVEGSPDNGNPIVSRCQQYGAGPCVAGTVHAV